MQAGQKYGMQTMNQALHAAWLNRLISSDEAMARSTDPRELEQMMTKGGHKAAA
jgi:Tfp pilus assembly pilus retraction ATPase PilT